jgi:protein-S-isoprenylcysteine O-methyltransferase Ste14
LSENPGYGGPPGWAALLLVGVFIVSMKISTEERLLGEVFGAEYEHYRQRVPQLVPGLRHLKELRRR